MFLDISKAFDKVWHDGLTFNLKTYDAEEKLIMLLEDYLKNRKQRVVINALSSSWKKCWQEFHRGQCWDHFSFTYIYKWFTSQHVFNLYSVWWWHFTFFKVKDSSLSLFDYNYDLETINQWAHQWKMSFNPDPNKQGADLLFCGKISSDDHPKLTFNCNQVQQCSSQKHLGLFLDNELDFNKHLDKKILNCKKPSLSVSRQSLFIKYL